MSDELWKLATGYATPEECNAALLEQQRTIRHYQTLLAEKERDLCDTINTLTRQGVEQRIAIRALGDALEMAEKAMAKSPAFNPWDLGPLDVLLAVRAALKHTGRKQ